MEKTTIAVKRISEFNVIENPSKRSSYKMVRVFCSINGKQAKMVIEEQYKSNYQPSNDKAAKMVSWHFTVGDSLIDANAKVMTDFSAYDVLDIEIDINDILFDAENLFADMKKKEEEKEEALAKIARAKAYDENYFLVTLKPALEAKGHVVTCGMTKEEFVANSFREVTLTVDGCTVDHDYHGWLQVRNGKGHGDLGAEGTTKSTKLAKHIDLIEQVIEADKQQTARKKEELKALAGAKENLESILGIQMVEKKEYHSRPSSHRGKTTGYETSYFVDARQKDAYDGSLKFVESSIQVGGKSTKGFRITNFPCIIDPAKLKKIVDLLDE